MQLPNFARKALAKTAVGLSKLAVSKGSDGNFDAIAVKPNSYAGAYGFSQNNIAGDYTLKKPSKVTFEALRQIAQYDAVTRICITAIKKSVSQSRWYITTKEGVELTPAIKQQLRYVEDLFKKQNRNNENMRLLLDRIIEDLLVLDAGVIEKVFNPQKELVGLNSVDGATIRPRYNKYGELGDPAYVQYVENKKTAEFSTEELIYMMQNPQNDIKKFGYGLSPIESVLLIVNASLQADMYNARTFSEDNVPPGLLDLGDISEEEAQRFKVLWDATVINNTHKMKFVHGPGDAKKYTPFKANNKDMQYVEYIDWLSRVKASAFGLSGIDINILQDVNRATAEVQEAISNSRGVMSVKRLIEEYFNRDVIMAMDFEDIEFRFEEATSLEEKKKQAEIDKINIESGVYSPEEVRERDGLSAEEDIYGDDWEDEGDEETPVEEDIDDPQKSYKQVRKNYYPPIN